MNPEPTLPAATVADCRIVDLATHSHGRDGNLTVVENTPSAPFGVKRVFYLYDLPGGASRGGHAHFALHQMIVAVSGSFTVTLDDGHSEPVPVMLNRSNRGLHVVPGIWCSLDNFSSGAIALVLCSDIYRETDYIRDHDRYLALAAHRNLTT